MHLRCNAPTCEGIVCKKVVTGESAHCDGHFPMDIGLYASLMTEIRKEFVIGKPTVDERICELFEVYADLMLTVVPALAAMCDERHSKTDFEQHAAGYVCMYAYLLLHEKVVAVDVRRTCINKTFGSTFDEDTEGIRNQLQMHKAEVEEINPRFQFGKFKREKRANDLAFWKVYRDRRRAAMQNECR